MSRTHRLAVRLAACLILIPIALWGSMIMWANREQAPISRAQAKASFDRGVDWLVHNESKILEDGNAALWWMLQLAENDTGDVRLQQLIGRFISHLKSQDGMPSAWLRLLKPEMPPNQIEAMGATFEAYQRFFFHAATCLPRTLDDGRSTTDFLTHHQCRPAYSRVWREDPVCSTHQLMGLMLYQQMRCTDGATQPSKRLADELVDDIGEQLWISPVFEDAYLQRVLMVHWARPDLAHRPIWLHRVVAAQSADGGWSGRYQMPEWPQWLQLSALKHLIKTSTGGESAGIAPQSDFHATAQGILLMALYVKHH